MNTVQEKKFPIQKVLSDLDNPNSIELLIQASAYDELNQRATIDVKATAPLEKIAELHAVLNSDDAVRKARAYAVTKLHIDRPAVSGLAASRPVPSKTGSGQATFVRSIKLEPSI